MGAPCVKYVLIIVNILIWLVGVVLLAAGVFALKPEFLKVFGDVADLIPEEIFSALESAGKPLGIGLCVTGGILFLLGFVGCCGAMCEQPMMLTVYAAILILIVLAEVALGLLIFFKKDEVFNVMAEELTKAFINDFSDDKSNLQSVAWHALQRQLKCCGVYNATDWIDTTWKTSQTIATVCVPATCCVMSATNNTVPENYSVCQQQAYNYQNSINQTGTDMFYSEGCAYKIQDFFEDKKWMALGVAAAIVGVQVAGVTMACTVRKYALQKKGDKYRH